MKYHTKVGIISIIIILLLMVISLIMSLSGYFPLAYEIYTKGFSGLGFIFVINPLPQHKLQVITP